VYETLTYFWVGQIKFLEKTAASHGRSTCRNRGGKSWSLRVVAGTSSNLLTHDDRRGYSDMSTASSVEIRDGC